MKAIRQIMDVTENPIFVKIDLPKGFNSEKAEIIVLPYKKTNDPIDSPALPGQSMEIKAFKKWIHDAEKMSSLDLTTAKKKWNIRKTQLQHRTIL